MSDLSITAASAKILLSIRGLFDVPQLLQGFAPDEVFDIPALSRKEVQIGVDGHMSAGFINVVSPMNITLAADSPSNLLFDAWDAAETAAQVTYFASGVLRLPAVERSYALTKGVLTEYTPAPPGKKVLQPRKYTITWNKIVGAPL